MQPNHSKLTSAIILGFLTLSQSIVVVGQIVQEDSVIVVADASYRAGLIHRMMMGNGYRDLWIAPINVPVLNLATYAGGLMPSKAHTGTQTTSLRLTGADGREYQFRAVDKDPQMALVNVLRPTLIGKALKDGASSTLPYGGVLAAEVLRIAGILHASPEVMVMPDTPALGRYRKRFAGMLGAIEVRADQNQEEVRAFAGAIKIMSSDELFARINEDPGNRIDTRTFLKARLVDLFIGDRDRHRENWRWAKVKEGDPVIWKPISRDHDHAFEDITGLIPQIAKNYTAGIVAYRSDYAPLYRSTWNGREVDRRFLSGLEKTAWDSVATELKADLTDEALNRVARLLPKEYYAVAGERLLAVMRTRRDYLLDEVDEFYRFLSKEVNIHATEAAEEAVVDLRDDRSVEITIRERTPGATPWFHRRFVSFETEEIRLRMFGGDDRVVVRGSGDPPISLRIAAGEGTDVLVDSTEKRRGRLHFYDQTGEEPYTRGHKRKVNRKAYSEWVGSDQDRYPPREWGTLPTMIGQMEFDSDYSLILGLGFTRTRYGFRKTPYANQTNVRLAVSSSPVRFRGSFSSQFQSENSDRSFKLYALISGMELLHFYGFGNDTRIGDHPSDFFTVRHRVYELNLSYIVPFSKTFVVETGPVFALNVTDDHENRLVTVAGSIPYGAEDIVKAGAHLSLVQDTRDRKVAPTSGYWIKTDLRYFPSALDVKSSFTRAHVIASTYLSRAMPMEPTLAVRVGADKLWGKFPFQEAAFIGGHSSLRGWRRERFAGDASLYGNLDLRLFVSRFVLSVPGEFGVFGLADAGRVYLNGASPGGWHTSAGAGLWFSVLNRSNLVSLGVAFNEERTAFFLKGGFDF